MNHILVALWSYPAKKVYAEYLMARHGFLESKLRKKNLPYATIYNAILNLSVHTTREKLYLTLEAPF